MKSKRSKACDIPKRVKDAVWERDGHRCVYCGSPQAMPNAHYIPRSKGGLGVERNVVTLCLDCHMKYDQSVDRAVIGKAIRNYLVLMYAGWKEQDLIYRSDI